MTPEPWAIFVEGNDDKPFIELLVGQIESLDAQVHRIGGGVNHLRDIAMNIRRCHDEGRGIALIADADQDIKARRQEAKRRIAELSLPISEEHVFLLPDSGRAGDLETLLEEMAVPRHRAIFDCLNAYNACLKQAAKGYREPGRKGRIYAYCEALDVEPRGPHRDYLDRDAWDLSAPAIEPLRSFLVSLS